MTNVTILVLFVTPMVTRTIRRKTIGTIELLSPSAHRFPDHHGQFGASAVDHHAVVSTIHIAILFAYARPALKPSNAYPGLCCSGLLHLGGPVHLQPDEESDRRRDDHVRRVSVLVGDHLDWQLRVRRSTARGLSRSSTTSTISAKASSTRRTSSIT
jgi:hypothetical protein